MRSFLYLLLLVFFTACSSSKKIQKELSQLERQQQYHIGLHVFDPKSNKTLVTWQDNIYMNPASNTKILTLSANLLTKADSTPGIRYQIINDSLFFEGTGDPTLFHPDLPESSVVSFLKNTRYPLVYVGEKLKDEKYGPGWAWDDYNDYYQVEKSALPLFGNFVRLTGDTNTKLRVYPDYWQSALEFDPTIKGIRRDIHKNTIKYSASPLPAQLNQDVPIITSDQMILQQLNKYLHKEVGFKAIELGKNALQIKGIQTDTVYRKMMFDSDNMLAEQLMLCYATENNLPLNTAQAIAHVKKNHFGTIQDQLIWKDGSGLSRYNLFTPRSLVQILHHTYQNIPTEKLLSYFPIAGKSGTVKYLLRDKKPFVYAKSGSFSNNYALSGFLITAKGKLLVFSIMNNNFKYPIRDIQTNVAKILLEIHNNY